ncbi:MAG: sugar-binding transcriptional regulator [Granulosicoccus sp.]|nr:sugar-binding transcriptional regulator [Granulosicoccus sp.]
MSVKPASSIDTDNLSVRAAWLHYAGGYTQADVAKKLGVTSLKAHRLITRANKDGLVKFHIDGEVAECAALENRLAAAFELEYCEVVPDLYEQGLPLRALGIAGAQYLKRVLENPDIPSIGIGHGRTLAACVHHLPHIQTSDKAIVSLLGGFSRKFSANPHDVIHRLAERTGASAFVMPIPFFVNTIENKQIILEQFGIAEVLDLARNTAIKVVGIGTVDEESSIRTNDMVDTNEMQAVNQAGGVGEMLGHFFDDDGSIVDTDLSDRTMGLAPDDLHTAKLLAVAGGSSKIRAINAILKSRLLRGLITDERTARALIDSQGNT